MIPLTPPGNGLPDNLPLLTEVADEAATDDLPTLTEVVAKGGGESATDQESSVPEAATAPPMASEEEMRLLRQLESRIEAIFARKLRLDLERLQHEAIEQALAELRAELPELLRDALKAHPGL